MWFKMQGGGGEASSSDSRFSVTGSGSSLLHEQDDNNRANGNHGGSPASNFEFHQERFQEGDNGGGRNPPGLRSFVVLHPESLKEVDDDSGHPATGSSSKDVRIDIPELLASVKRSVTGLEDKFTKQENTIKQISINVEKLEETAKPELLAASIKGSFTGLEEKFTTQEAAIEQISTDAGRLEETVQNLEKTPNPELLAIKVSVTGLEGKFTTQENTIKKIDSNVTGLKTTVENMERTVNPPAIQRTQSQEDTLARETDIREINERQTRIISEENELEQRLKSSLEKGLMTIATVFIYCISFIASSQQPSIDLSRFILEATFIGIIWLATIFLFIIWWFELKNIENEIISLEERQRELVRDPKSEGIIRIRPDIRLSTFKSYLCRFFIVVLAVLATVVSVYFVYSTYSLWSSPTPSPSPSALPAIQLPSTVPLTTQDYAAQ